MDRSGRVQNRTPALLLAALLLAGALTAPAAAAEPEAARELTITVTDGDGKALKRLTDGSYDTTAAVSPGSPLTVTAEDGQILGLYVVWSEPPAAWTLRFGEDRTAACGEHGFLHEYVPLEDGAESVSIEVAQKEALCQIRAWSGGTLPEEVQVWEPACEQADFLLFSTHADDEILFLGGIEPLYAGERGLGVQVLYFSNYFGSGEPEREHEKLDGLWACGVRNYPVNAPFHDEYTGSLEAAKRVYSYDGSMEWLLEQIRRFKPLVCVAQDVKGEYGHGTHIFTSALMREAVTVSMDPAVCPASAERYGVWDVPKTYIHLYDTGKIELDTRTPLDAFGGRTCLEVAKRAYTMHVSQQKWSFRVDDEYKYSMARFGLYRTTVGEDTGNDMMEHLTSWEEQAREEAERLAREEAERLAREEEERRAREEAEREEAERAAREEAERIKAQEDAARALAEQERLAQLRRVVVLCAVAVAVCALAGLAAAVAAVLKGRRDES